MSEYKSKSLLLIAKFVQEDLLSRNTAGFIKELLLRSDTRFLHYTDRFNSGRDSLAKYLENLHVLAEGEACKIFSMVFSELPLQKAKSLSRAERSTNKDLPVTTSLTYGEIDFSSFYKILRRLGPCRNKIFYDLGSGTGRAVIEARLVMDFAKCKGIEILKPLHDAAVIVNDRFLEHKRSLLALTKDGDMSLVEGSITDISSDVSCNWTDGDIVFANSTCFDKNLIDEISEIGDRLKPGSIFITFTKGLTSSAFELIDKSRLKMSWGPATVYIQRRLQYNGKSVGGPSPLDAWKISQFLHSNNKKALLELTEQGDSSASSMVLPGEHTECLYKVKLPIKKVGDITEIKYLFRSVTPSNLSTSIPLVVFLHGASARGNSFENHLNMALPSAIEDCEADGSIDSDNYFHLLAPLCPMGVEWKTPNMSDAIIELIEAISKTSTLNIDRSRVYLTGVSMGGLGSWMLAAKAPKNTFAAVSCMCGGGSPLYARLVTDIPMWFYHSAEDNVVGVEETEALYAALLKEGSTVSHFTRYSSCPEPAAQSWMVGHNCWSRTYRDPKFWKWFLSQKAFTPH